MKVNVLKHEDNELKIEVEGETHTLMNALQKTLLDKTEVELAGFHVPHPLVNSTVFHVRTKTGKKVLSVIIEAAKELKRNAEDFRKAFDKALKEYEKTTPSMS